MFACANRHTATAVALAELGAITDLMNYVSEPPPRAHLTPLNSQGPCPRSYFGSSFRLRGRGVSNEMSPPSVDPFSLIKYNLCLVLRHPMDPEACDQTSPKLLQLLPSPPSEKWNSLRKLSRTPLLCGALTPQSGKTARDYAKANHLTEVVKMLNNYEVSPPHFYRPACFREVS